MSLVLHQVDKKSRKGVISRAEGFKLCQKKKNRRQVKCQIPPPFSYTGFATSTAFTRRLSQWLLQ
ncbi:hypothetical protein GHT06_008703 [Daphnia sinensis]|uniref:Uncharacterized protein n=1 Tax=Daphnia sinensis TaxID=1820382 RepID=A0AAD5PZ59_9CRUS|nr:hypothetical protein GHT06_008703 [Daphnia sinensis]